MRISDWSSDVCSSDLTAPPWALYADLPADRRRPGRPVHALAHVFPAGRGPGLGLCAGTTARQCQCGAYPRRTGRGIRASIARSEEHTSELQSLMRISYAVFCLKKKKKKIYTYTS